MKKYEDFCMKLSSTNSNTQTNNNNADLYWMDSLRPNHIAKKSTLSKKTNLNSKNKTNLKSNNIVNILDKNNNNVTRNIGQKLLKVKNRTNSTNISRSTSISLEQSISSPDKNPLLLKKIKKNNSTILNNKNPKRIITSANKLIPKRNLNISLSYVGGFNTTIYKEKEKNNNTIVNNEKKDKDKNINNNNKNNNNNINKNNSKKEKNNNNKIKNYYLETESSSMKRNFGRAIKDKPKKLEIEKNLTERNFYNNNNKNNTKKKTIIIIIYY